MDTPHSSSPTCTYGAFRFTLGHAAQHGHVLLQNDVDDAYLNSRAESLVIMRFPFGFETYLFYHYGPDRSAWPYDPRTHVCVVYGNIWGHPDAGRIWDAAFTRLLTDVLMFTPTPLDPRLFFRYEPGSPPTMLALIVDDYFVTGAGNIAADVDAQINEKFKTKGAKPARDALGLDVDRVRMADGTTAYTLSQDRAVLRILEQEDMLELRRYADSPLSSGWTATTDVGDVTSESYGSPPRKWENPARTV